MIPVLPSAYRRREDDSELNSCKDSPYTICC